MTFLPCIYDAPLMNVPFSLSQTRYRSYIQECQGSEVCDRSFSVRLQMHDDRRLAVYYYPPTNTRASFCANIRNNTDIVRSVYTDVCDLSSTYPYGYTIHSRPSNKITPLGFVMKNNTHKTLISLRVSIDRNGFMNVDLNSRFNAPGGPWGRTTARWFIGSNYSITSLYAWMAYGHEPPRPPVTEANQFITIGDWSLTLS